MCAFVGITWLVNMWIPRLSPEHLIQRIVSEAQESAF